MFYLMSLAGLVGGSLLAAAGQRFPARSATLETFGGVLLVGGLAMLGAALPHTHL